MASHKDFLKQLENLRNEANSAALYIYGGMAMEHAASLSPRLLRRLNATPTYWLTSGSAFQTAGYMAIARAFDRSSRYNISKLLDAAEDQIHVFQREALADRRRDGRKTDPPWLAEFLDQRAYYPTVEDFARLRRKFLQYREIYRRLIEPARYRHIGHRVEAEGAKVKKLYGGGTVRELWRLSIYLLQLHEALRELYVNGRKPTLRPMRHSVIAIFNSKAPRSEIHEHIVHEVKTLASIIDAAGSWGVPAPPPLRPSRRLGRLNRSGT